MEIHFKLRELTCIVGKLLAEIQAFCLEKGVASTFGGCVNG